MKINPNKYVRAAYLAGMKDHLDVPAWDRRVPSSVVPLPPVYVLIASETRSKATRTKCGYDWLYSITLDIIQITERSTVNTSILDDIEEDIMNMIEDGLQVDKFEVRNSEIEQSIDVSIETDTTTTSRKILTFTHLLSQTSS